MLFSFVRQVREFEEIGAAAAEVESAVTDAAAFQSVVSLVSFQPFKTAADALENVNAVSEGVATDRLKVQKEGGREWSRIECHLSHLPLSRFSFRATCPRS